MNIYYFKSSNLNDEGIQKHWPVLSYILSLKLSSLYHYKVQTISSSKFVLTYIGCLALRKHLFSTLLVYSHEYFSHDILSIVVEPSRHRRAWLLIVFITLKSIIKSFQQFTRFFSCMSPYTGYITLYIQTYLTLDVPKLDRVRSNQEEPHLSNSLYYEYIVSMYSLTITDQDRLYHNPINNGIGSRALRKYYFLLYLLLYIFLNI